MKPSARLVRRIIKFTSCMQCGIYKTSRRYSFLVHPYRHTTAIICNGSRSIFFQRHFNMITKSCQMLIYRIIYHLIDQMVQSFRGYASNVHSRTFPDCLKTFQHRNTVCIICIFLCHAHFPFHFFSHFTYIITNYTPFQSVFIPSLRYIICLQEPPWHFSSLLLYWSGLLLR